MENIAIIAAEEKEVTAVKSIMDNVITGKVFNITYYTGSISGINCVLARSGEGKVNSARTTQIMIDKFNVSSVINIGAAGATRESSKIGDIVISTGLVQYDFDVTAFGREKGFLPNIGKIFEADKKLIGLCEEAFKLCEIPYEKGIIATGDRFVSNVSDKIKIGEEFDAKCVEMEGAAIAHVCKLCDVPFVVIRSISDELCGDAKVDFDKFLDTASKKCADVLKAVFKLISRY